MNANALQRKEHQIASMLLAAYNKLKRLLSGLLAKFLQGLKAAPRSFIWLYEHNRLPGLYQQIMQAMNAYTAFVEHTVMVARQEATYLGNQALSTYSLPISTFSGMSQQIAHKIESILMLAVDGLHPSIEASLATLLDEPRWRMLTLLRTEMWNAYRSALQVGFAMSGAIEWQWIAHEGACPRCIAMNGTKHPIEEKMNTHPNCRCTMKPIMGIHV